MLHPICLTTSWCTYDKNHLAVPCNLGLKKFHFFDLILQRWILLVLCGIVAHNHLSHIILFIEYCLHILYRLFFRIS